jgi:glyoxylase-like metal-dependent hydrolase (beta-lactamase superfamily II)
MQRWKIGRVTVTKIVELEKRGTWGFLLPDATPERIKPIDWLRPHFVTDEGELVLSIHALVVETPERRIVVDTCIGNDKTLPLAEWSNLQGSFLRDMAEAGYPLESIDTVFCTHLHLDHVGWNTMLVDGRWVPTFTRARYLMAESEFAYWRAQKDDEGRRRVFEDSVRPVFDAGLVDLVETTHRICDEVSLIPTLGHTPGHASVLIASQGERGLITGDFMHHPCQMVHLDWCSSVDYDPAEAIETRRRVLSTYADTPTLVIGTHFAGATAGRIIRDGEAFRLVV